MDVLHSLITSILNNNSVYQKSKLILLGVFPKLTEWKNN